MTAFSLMQQPELNPFDPLGAFFKSFLPGADAEFGSVRVRDGWSVYQVHVDLPGFIHDDIKVYAREGQLVITARSSRNFLSNQRLFTKSLPLPEHVDVRHISYTYERNKLVVKIPKSKRSFLF